MTILYVFLFAGAVIYLLADEVGKYPPGGGEDVIM